MRNIIRKNSEIENILDEKRKKRQAKFDRRKKRREKEEYRFNGIKI